jgi:hypothetical protein
MVCCAWSTSRAGEAAMATPPLFGEPVVKNGTDLAHSFVYCAAVVRVAPNADSSGDVVAL